MKLALYAVPNLGEAAREHLFPWHAVHIDLEEREFEENRKKWQKEHAKKFSGNESVFLIVEQR